jgi:predicted acyltransferase
MQMAEPPLQSELSVPESSLPAKRADALDALRGFAILAMVFSGTLRYKILPAWMYHAQEPPPTHAFNKAIAGLTWVDVVFPLFLFALGAAIPLALSRRLDQGWSKPKIIGYILRRGLLLGAFAIILQHLRPFSINSDPTDQTWYLAMLGFVLLFLMFGRWSTTGNLGWLGKLLTGAGWLGAIALISQLTYGGKGFELTRSDPILLSLANMAVFGALVWLCTHRNIFLRVGLLGILLALQFSSGSDGWVKALWGSSPIPWLFQFYFLKYLFIVVPGTIAGDLLLQWSQTPDRDDFLDKPRTQQRLWLVVLSMLMICLVLLVGLQSRSVLLTILMSSAICAASWLLFAPLQGSTATLIKHLFQWGIYWLILGLCFEPFQGGIHKDPSTYSYYFVTSAIALFLLITFTVLIDYFRYKKPLQLLIDNGQNPMIAYVAFANLLWPILQITRLEDWVIEVTNTPFLGVIKGIAYTLPIALLTSFCSRIRLFWRT